ncbi:hypothetical protein [Azospirillum formosense]|uniref:hypothetical protein n=1 Tax=Azospirillum formosense TaxID=861533 RepID=UPI001C90E5A4|nr:hypothetical protein [Azospirillum formosense]
MSRRGRDPWSTGGLISFASGAAVAILACRLLPPGTLLLAVRLAGQLDPPVVARVGGAGAGGAVQGGKRCSATTCAR